MAAERHEYIWRGTVAWFEDGKAPAGAARVHDRPARDKRRRAKGPRADTRTKGRGA